LTLAIDKPDDIVAFAALAVTGLIAAAFGRRRVRAAEQASGVRHDLEALEQVSADLASGAPLDVVLEHLRRSFGLGGVVLRRPDGGVLAASRRAADRSPPVTALERPTLLAPGERQHRFGGRGFRLPEGGGRLSVDAGGERLWLDVWEGDAEGLAPDDRRALVVAIAMLELGLVAHPASSASTPRNDGRDDSDQDP
jgi:hypothetical protein